MTTGAPHGYTSPETDYARESVYTVRWSEPEIYHAESVDSGHDSTDQRTRRAIELADRKYATEEMSVVK